MSNRNLKNKLTSDIRARLAAIIDQHPELSPEAAMARVTQEMLKNNPFTPPEGNSCPVNILPDELLACIFGIGVLMETEYSDFADTEFEEHGWRGEFNNGCSENEEAVGKEVVDLTKGGGGDDGNWSDVDDDEIDMMELVTRKSNAKEDDEESSDLESDLDDIGSGIPPPFQVLVSHVCKRWRAVALESSGLWNHINFSKHTGASLDKHKTYLERARDTPLHLTLYCGNSNTYQYSSEAEEAKQVGLARDKELLYCLRRSLNLSDETLPPIFNDPSWYTRHELVDNPPTEREHYYGITEFSNILDMIIPHVRKWAELTVSVNDYRWMYLVLARLHQCPPAERLEMIELNYFEDERSNEQSFHPRHLDTKFRLFQGQAPRLTVCTLRSVHLDWEGSLGFFNNVEEIELAYHVEAMRPSYQAFESMVKSSPNLKALTLCLSGPKDSEDHWRDVNAEPIQLSSIETLALQYHSVQYARSLLRFLDTPNITSLLLEFNEGDFNEFAKDLCKAPFGRSKSLLAGLEDLRIQRLPCNRAVVERMLDQLVNLTSLKLKCNGYGDAELFWEALVRTATRAVSGSSSHTKKIYCPALETIRTTGIAGQSMKDFLELRTKAGVPLKKVFMCNVDHVDPVTGRWIKQHVGEFEVFYHTSSDEDLILGLGEDDDDDHDLEDDFDGDDDFEFEVEDDLDFSGEENGDDIM